MKFYFNDFLSKYLLVIAVFIFFVPFNSWSQKTYMPDDIFEAWCEGNGFGDGIAFNDSVSTSSISAITNMNISNKGIADLTGISDFSNLDYLNCSNNALTVLDLSSNYMLGNINAYGNDSLSQFYLPDSCFYPTASWSSQTGWIPGMSQIQLYECNLTSLDVDRP